MEDTQHRQKNMDGKDFLMILVIALLAFLLGALLIRLYHIRSQNHDGLMAAPAIHLPASRAINRS